MKSTTIFGKRILNENTDEPQLDGIIPENDTPVDSDESEGIDIITQAVLTDTPVDEMEDVEQSMSEAIDLFNYAMKSSLLIETLQVELSAMTVNNMIKGGLGAINETAQDSQLLLENGFSEIIKKSKAKLDELWKKFSDFIQMTVQRMIMKVGNYKSHAKKIDESGLRTVVVGNINDNLSIVDPTKVFMILDRIESVPNAVSTLIDRLSRETDDNLSGWTSMDVVNYCNKVIYGDNSVRDRAKAVVGDNITSFINGACVIKNANMSSIPFSSNTFNILTTGIVGFSASTASHDLHEAERNYTKYFANVKNSTKTLFGKRTNDADDSEHAKLLLTKTNMVKTVAMGQISVLLVCGMKNYVRYLNMLNNTMIIDYREQ